VSVDQPSDIHRPESEKAEEADTVIHPRSPMALSIKVYGENPNRDEPLDVHETWVSATDNWTFDEVRHVLWVEAGDYDYPIAGWCRCGDHGDAIEDFLREYGIAFDDEGNLHDLLDEDQQDGEALSRTRPSWNAIMPSPCRAAQVKAGSFASIMRPSS
jgi:hypothetical protein